MTPAQVDELCHVVRQTVLELRAGAQSMSGVMIPIDGAMMLIDPAMLQRELGNVITNYQLIAARLEKVVGGVTPQQVWKSGGIPLRPFMPSAGPSFDKPEMAVGTPLPGVYDRSRIEGMLIKAMKARLISTFGMSTEATFIDTDPVLEARPKQPALLAPTPPPVSSETISEAWAQELARYQATKA